MSDTAGEAAPPEPAVQEPANPATVSGWFGQIPFNPRTGLDSVLPMSLPDQQSRRIAEAGDGDG